MQLHSILRLLLCCSVCDLSTAFVVGPHRQHHHQRHAFGSLARTSTSRLLVAVDDLTRPEKTVCKLMDQLHDSKYDFRIVVIGNGAILETTSVLGPTMNLSRSPATQETILTLASTDQSFEFHLKPATVYKIVITEKESPATNRVMRILRFLNVNGDAMCSLILQDSSDGAIAWFEALREEYGEDVQL